MDLEVKLRFDFNNKIRPFFIKGECECCGESDEELHLHHNIYFSKLMSETLELFSLENKDHFEYTDDELRNVRTMMLGKQMNIDYTTCCRDCHIKLHNGSYKQTCDRNKLNKEDRKELFKYIKSLTNINIFKEEKENIINRINYRKNGRIIKRHSILNEYLSYNNIPYIITTKIIYVKRIQYKVWNIIHT